MHWSVRTVVRQAARDGAPAPRASYWYGSWNPLRGCCRTFARAQAPLNGHCSL